MSNLLDALALRRPCNRLRVVVLGYIVRGPLAGLAWHHLQYILGLAKLGHDVMFVEDSDDYESCYDPTRNEMSADPAYGLRFVEQVFRRVGLGERWSYFDAHTRCWLGPAAPRMPEFCRSADLLIDVSGVNPVRDWWEHVPVRALIDTDPVFTQLRHIQEPGAAQRAQQFTAFFSFGETIGSRRGAIPSDGLPWRITRQPMVLEAWPVLPPAAEGAFTTVMLWDSYKCREHAGRLYGMKSESFGPYMDLPRRTREALEMAVGKPAAPRDLLREHGWRVRDPLELTRDAWTYQRYLQSSKGEFTVAKHGYVVSRSGWFSERSAGYLASGRPVIAQETGFSDCLPTGAGLLAFSTPDEALAAIEEVAGRYALHCRAARAVAEECFDSGVVLNRLIDEAFSLPEPAAQVAQRSVAVQGGR
jgi:hypothetical protein